MFLLDLLDLRGTDCRYSYSYSSDSYSHYDTETCNSSHYSNYCPHGVILSNSSTCNFRYCNFFSVLRPPFTGAPRGTDRRETYSQPSESETHNDTETRNPPQHSNYRPQGASRHHMSLVCIMIL